MQKKRSFHYTANVGNLKKKRSVHTSNSTHETESMQPQAILPPFFRSPNSASHQKSTQKVNDYGKK